MKVTKESETKPGFCQCGRPLHYTNASIQEKVDKIVGMVNDPFVDIHIGNRTYRVQRHFIALHGFSDHIGREYGFEYTERKTNDITGRS